MNPNTKRHSPRGLLGPGKGDVPRHKLDDNYRANFDAINWGNKAPVDMEDFFDKHFGNEDIDIQPL